VWVERGECEEKGKSRERGKCGEMGEIAVSRWGRGAL